MLNLFFQHSRNWLSQDSMRLCTIWTSWTSWAGSLECWKSRINMKSNFKSWFLVQNLALEDYLTVICRIFSANNCEIKNYRKFASKFCWPLFQTSSQDLDNAETKTIVDTRKIKVFMIHSLGSNFNLQKYPRSKI